MSDGFAGRYEVLEDRGSGRRTWPADGKLRIAAESHAPGAMVGEVARAASADAVAGDDVATPSP